MKRDIKLNIQTLHRIRLKIETYIGCLELLQNASQTFLETIKDQDSQAYEKLSGLWEKDIVGTESLLKERLTITGKVLGDYIRTMEFYIAPKAPEIDMRVDRNDIWWNCKQIEKRLDDCESILMEIESSDVDYEQLFIYNIFQDQETNEARKSAIEEEEKAERGRRERNYTKLKEFQQQMQTKVETTFSDCIEDIWKIYDNNVIPFENTDDDYKRIMDDYYDEWMDFWDCVEDLGRDVWNIGSGLVDPIKDLEQGINDVLTGLFEIVLWLSVKDSYVDTVGLMPEKVDADVRAIGSGIAGMLTDPGNVLEAMGQDIADTTDEKGLAYSISYTVMDLVILDKALGAIGKAGKLDDIADTAGDVVKAAGGVGDEVVEGAIKGGSVPNTLTDAQKSRLNTLDNIIDHNLKETDFSGTLRDLQGNPVPDLKGGYYDHLTEMKQSYTALNKIKKGLEGSLQNPNLSNVDREILQNGLDEANLYIQRIEELFEPFGGIK